MNVIDKILNMLILNDKYKKYITFLIYINFFLLLVQKLYY
jgi:hypothetical protein